MEHRIGTFSELGRGSLVRVLLFRHGPGEHRDPPEEVLEASSVVLTSSGSWSVRAPGVDGDASPSTALVGGRGGTYRCRHPRRPTDRTLAIDVLPAGERESIPDLPAERTALVPVSPELEARRTRVVRAALGPAADRRLALDSAALELFRTAWSLAHSGTPPTTAGSTSTDDVDRIDLALRWLDDHLAADVGLAELSAAAGLSPFHFVRVFRARTGDTPMRFVRHRRVERAAILLRETDLTVTEVALDAGFGSLSHFVTVFRDATGLPPGRWRRARRRAG